MEHGTFVGWTGDDVLHSLYRIADLCVVPSIYEPFGLVALEAMASGCPAIVADTGGLREVVPGGRRVGLRFRARDSSSLARMAQKLLTDDALRDRLVAQAREHVLQFDWADVARQTEAIYESCAARASERARVGRGRSPRPPRPRLRRPRRSRRPRRGRRARPSARPRARPAARGPPARAAPSARAQSPTTHSLPTLTAPVRTQRSPSAVPSPTVSSPPAASSRAPSPTATSSPSTSRAPGPARRTTPRPSRKRAPTRTRGRSRARQTRSRDAGGGTTASAPTVSMRANLAARTVPSRMGIGCAPEPPTAPTASG